LVVTGARCPLTKPVVAAVELQATTEPHCSRGVQPGGICVYVVQREPTPEGPGSGLRPGRGRFLYQLPLWFYIYNEEKRRALTTSCRMCCLSLALLREWATTNPFPKKTHALSFFCPIAVAHFKENGS
jgi:hypothetical protein